MLHQLTFSSFRLRIFDHRPEGILLFIISLIFDVLCNSGNSERIQFSLTTSLFMLVVEHAQLHEHSKTIYIAET